MIVRPAEESFQKGCRALRRGHLREAKAFFEASIELARQFSDEPPQARYLSFYGRCLSQTSGRSGLGSAEEICGRAAEAEPFNADLWENLAAVSMVRGRRRSAYRAILRGLQANPKHRGLNRRIRQLGVRRRPILGFLSRDSLVNRFAGRVLKWMQATGADHA